MDCWQWCVLLPQVRAVVVVVVVVKGVNRRTSSGL
jgi:hypothetical protein